MFNKLPIVWTLIILGLYIFVSISNGETLNRDIVSQTGDISCSSFPCVINCNAINSCYHKTISCPTSGSGGSCTININGDSGGEGSTINGGAATNIFINANAYESLWAAKINLGDINDLSINVVGTNRGLYDAVITISSMTGDLNFNANGNSYHAFYSGVLTINGDIDGNINIIESTSGNSVNANFAAMTLTVNGDIGQSALFQAKIDNGQEAFTSSTMTITGTINNDLTYLSGTFGSFSENKITINGDVNGNVLFQDTSSLGHGFCCSQYLLTIYGSVGGNFTIIDDSTNGRAGYDTILLQSLQCRIECE